MAHAKNRGDRNRIQALRFLRRLKKRGMNKDTAISDPDRTKCYRTTGTPCSCSLCDPHKRAEEKHSVVKKKESLDDQEP